jgi:cell fate regulator YaaT (PSP1 superfamily)
MSGSNEQDNLEEDLSHLEDADASDADGRETKGEGLDLPYPVFRIKINHSSETLLAQADKPEEIVPGEAVIINTRYGRDLAEVLGPVRHPGRVSPDEVAKIERPANAEEIKKRAAYAEREKDAFKICQQKINDHGLSMKLVSAHYVLDEPKVLFFFTAEARVDFRELVKDLVSVFKMRIELRQIGVRDEARVLGGVGVCGQVFCCHAVTDKLNAVSIKMAKDQNLSLNSMKISGPCGRLLCCLSYEFQHYRDERRTLPSEGAKIPYDGSVFRVNEINILKSMVRLTGEDGRILKLPARRFKRGEDNRWQILEDLPVKEE